MVCIFGIAPLTAPATFLPIKGVFSSGVFSPRIKSARRRTIMFMVSGYTTDREWETDDADNSSLPKRPSAASPKSTSGMRSTLGLQIPPSIIIRTAIVRNLADTFSSLGWPSNCSGTGTGTSD
ncbi:hypothetical protein U1Q18_047826 [Sarracenia purpurea var. burkii]